MHKSHCLKETTSRDGQYLIRSNDKALNHHFAEIFSLDKALPDSHFSFLNYSHRDTLMGRRYTWGTY
jgi:hypothetical protein